MDWGEENEGRGAGHTIKLSKHAVHGAGAAAAAHADIKFVGMFCGHDCCFSKLFLVRGWWGSCKVVGWLI